MRLKKKLTEEPWVQPRIMELRKAAEPLQSQELKRRKRRTKLEKLVKRRTNWKTLEEERRKEEEAKKAKLQRESLNKRKLNL